MSLSVQKRFGDTLRDSKLPLSFPSLNDFHQTRYSDFHGRTGGGSIGKPVVPVYKHSHYDDPSLYLDNMRGHDDRNVAQTIHSIRQKLKDTTALQQRPFS